MCYFNSVEKTAVVKPNKQGRTIVALCLLLIDAINKDQVPKLAEIKILYEYEVIVVPHGRLNICRRVFTCKDLVYCTDEELCSGMKYSRVIANPNV